MLKNILWIAILYSAILVMAARDDEQKREWENSIQKCIETGQHCPNHLRGE